MSFHEAYFALGSSQSPGLKCRMPDIDIPGSSTGFCDGERIAAQMLLQVSKCSSPPTICPERDSSPALQNEFCRTLLKTSGAAPLSRETVPVVTKGGVSPHPRKYMGGGRPGVPRKRMELKGKQPQPKQETTDDDIIPVTIPLSVYVSFVLPSLFPTPNSSHTFEVRRYTSPRNVLLNAHLCQGDNGECVFEL